MVRLPGSVVVLLVCFVVVFVHVLMINRVHWLPGDLIISFSLVWIDYGFFELVGVVAVGWHVLDGGVDKGETLL